ncbi:MAG: ketopantoate reductase family protein, partial [Polyangiaceae bacterium]
GGEALGKLILQRMVRRLALELMTEVVHVARAEKIHLEKVSGTLDLEWIALTESERRAIGSPSLLAKHSMLLAVGARYRRMRSSMLAALERGRPPSVDFLNGEVVSRGKKHGISTPVNAHATALVWEIAHGKRKPSQDTLRELSQRTALE